MKKLFSIICGLILMATTAMAVNVYINPGHGLWDGNGRNMKLVGHELGDTTGFWESNTNLWKAHYLREQLEAVGITVKMSHTHVGPKGMDGVAPYGGKDLDVIAAESSSCGATYFISIHSNANVDGDRTDWPTFFYNTGIGDSYNMAQASNLSWLEIWTIDVNATDKIEYCSYNSYINGDLRTGRDEYGVMRTNSVPGFMTEAFFHTYRPHRHRAANPDRCCIEGEAYARPIRAFFNKPASTKGYIYGVVVSDTEDATEPMYYDKNHGGWQGKLPLQGAEVYLCKSNGDTVKGYDIHGFDIYPFGDRLMKNQDHYTTDDYYNGVFVFKELDPDTYTMHFHKAGYADKTTTIVVTANHTSCQVVRMSKEIDPNAKVEYELNGGTADAATLPAKVTEEYTLPAPTKTNEYFRGWYWDAAFTDGPVLTIKPGDNGTLYAKWATTPITLNPYALKLSIKSQDENTVTIAYTLSAYAQGLDLLLMDGTEVKGTIAIAENEALTPGTHEVTISLADRADAGTYTWALKATGFAVTEPEKGTEDCEKLNFYWGSGMAINNHVESPYFGNIYVTESWAKTTNAGKQTVQGMKIFGADLSTDGQSYAGSYQGAPINWISDPSDDGNGMYKTIHGPMRVCIDEDDYVYVNDNGRWSGVSPVTTQLWRMNPASPAGEWDRMFDPAYRESGSNKTYTRLNAMTVKGSGENRRLYIADWSDDIVYFDFGNTTNIASGRTQWANLPSSSYSQVPDRTLINAEKGGIWMFQYTNGNSKMPLVSHWTANGTCNFKHYADGDATDNMNGGGAISEDGTMLAFCGGQSLLIYTISYADDVPSLTKLYSLPIKAAGGIAFDVVNNIYAVSSSSQYLEGYALPRTDNTYTTYADEASTITITEVTGLINVNDNDNDNQKLMKDGQLIIIRDGVQYNAMGQIVE